MTETGPDLTCSFIPGRLLGSSSNRRSFQPTRKGGGRRVPAHCGYLLARSHPPLQTCTNFNTNIRLQPSPIQHFPAAVHAFDCEKGAIHLSEYLAPTVIVEGPQAISECQGQRLVTCKGLVVHVCVDILVTD